MNIKPHSHKELIEEYEKSETANERFFELQDIISNCLSCQNYIHFNFHPRQRWDLYREGVLKEFNRKSKLTKL